MVPILPCTHVFVDSKIVFARSLSPGITTAAAIINTVAIPNISEMPNPLLLETQKFYPKEFAAAQRALLFVEKDLGVTLPETEAGFIAFHIVNSSQGNDNGNERK